MMERLFVERISMVGGGRHMRLRLRQGRHMLNAIYFSATPETASIQPGDLVDVAFQPQVNEFRGTRTPQLNVWDIRPSCAAPCSANSAGYRALCRGQITAADAAQLLPDRATLALVWRYLAASATPLKESPMCLCRKIVRWSGLSLNLGQLLTCLDIFSDVGLLRQTKQHKYIHIDLTTPGGKADLTQSRTMQLLLQAKES
jgi:single-stranded-DNA-specific exonuclease